MRRLIAVAFLLAAPLLWAQVHGIPPSVTSISPGHPISSAPPASVTSLGPFGFNTPDSFVGFPVNLRFRTRFGNNFVPFNGINRFDRFRHRGQFVGAIPIVVPFYDPMPVYPTAVYPTPTDYPMSYDAPARLPVEVRVVTVPQAAADPAPAPVSASASAPVSKDSDSTPKSATTELPDEETTVLVFRDGHRLEVRNYAIVNGELHNFSGKGPRRIALAELDLQATARVNDDRGVEFKPPARGN